MSYDVQALHRKIQSVIAQGIRGLCAEWSIPARWQARFALCCFRLGGAATIHADVRVICATHRNLMEMINERQFRTDLFYRLSVFPN